MQAAPIVVEIALVGSQENPPVTGPGSGFARLTFDEATKKLDYAVTISGITADEVTAAHIHRGAPGVNGPIVHNLSTVGFTTIGGTIILSDADIADLKAGNLYVNAHSKTNPGGFARGQINLTPDAALRAAIIGATDAWNKKDVARFLSYFTASGLEAVFELDPATAVEELNQFIGEAPVTLVNLSNVMSLGATSASATVDLNNGGVRERNEWIFTLVGGVWKVSGGTIGVVPIPSGTATVPVQLREFAFVFDKSAVASGNFAFAATNVGQQFHELALAKIPANANLQELLASEEDVPGFEFIGAVFAEPGGRANMVFSQPLSPGRYALVCFIPDQATGTPHAFLGMATDFMVGGGGGGGTVRPPSTGDGGLVGDSSSKDALLVGGILGLLAGGAIALTTRRAHVQA